MTSPTSLQEIRNVKLQRSLLFLWVTGEEKGLLGSKYFAAKPTVAKSSIVADINTDMFLPIFPLKVLTVYGLDESSLGGMVLMSRGNKVCRCNPTPNRCAMRSSAAINTALFGREYRRWQ